MGANGTEAAIGSAITAKYSRVVVTAGGSGIVLGSGADGEQCQPRRAAVRVRHGEHGGTDPRDIERALQHGCQARAASARSRISQRVP